MRMKQIIAKDMKEAMLMAREELGEDAVLLSSEKRKNKMVVVTFGIEDEAFEDAFADPLDQFSNDNELDDGITEADEEIAAPANNGTETSAKAISPNENGFSLSHKAAQTRPSAPSLNVPRSAYPAYELLLSILNHHRVPEDLYINITALLDKIEMPKQLSYDSCEQILTTVLKPNIDIKPLDAAPTQDRSKALMVLGGHGCGKTTLIAKLAIAAHMQKTPVLLLSTDTHHLAGTATLEVIKDNIDCELQIVESRNELKSCVKEALGEKLVLVDTPGVNIYDFQEMKALGEMASLADIEPILACPAGLDPDEAIEMASVFSFLNIERFALTKADSARHFSAVYALLHRDYALACVSDSTKASDPIQTASYQLLSELSCAYIKERMAN